jgi:hypothetical protein
MVRPEEESDVWRILLFGRCGEELLLLRTPSGFRLPELHIPRCQRVAPNLNAEAKRLWNLDTVCLLPLEISRGDLAVGGSAYYVMEVCGSQELVRVAPDFVQMSALKEDSFADLRDYLAVRQEMEPRTAGLAEDHRGPFSGFGAFEKISAWVEEQLLPLGLRLDGSFRQLLAAGSFALIRFDTDRSAVWFKAVGEPNLREFAITVALTARLPGFLPELLAARPDWNAWLVNEVEGQDLFATSDPVAWCRAATSLADLQTSSIPDVSHILAAGARDVRSQRLLDVARPFFSAMGEIMEAQTKATPRKLGRQEIRTVQDQVVEVLYRLCDAGIPDTLNHLDLNPGNVIVSTSKCLFLDWAEGAVGNPFFSMEYLRQHFLQAFPGQQEAELDFRKSYLNHWTAVADKTAEDLSRFAPLAAVFAFAASALPWDDPKMGQRQEFAGYLRSLVRRMHRESEQIRASRAA